MDQFRPDVVAGKYDPLLFDPSGERLRVNEVFYTIQGEGKHAGRAATFVRLSKCNLACKFCDTEFEAGRQYVVKHENQKEATGWEPDLLHAIRYARGRRPAPHAGELVVLTGGEPGLQNCQKLINVLHEEGFLVCLETSGSVWSEWMADCYHICVSPKVPLARVPEQLKAEADEFKWIVNATFLRMFEQDPSQLYHLGSDNYLQPESLNGKWTEAASKLVMMYPHRYKLSLQTHKLAGNR